MTRLCLVPRLSWYAATLAAKAAWKAAWYIGLSGARGLHCHESLVLRSRHVASVRSSRTRNLVREDGCFTVDGLKELCTYLGKYQNEVDGA